MCLVVRNHGKVMTVLTGSMLLNGQEQDCEGGCIDSALGELSLLRLPAPLLGPVESLPAVLSLIAFTSTCSTSSLLP